MSKYGIAIEETKEFYRIYRFHMQKKYNKPKDMEMIGERYDIRDALKLALEQPEFYGIQYIYWEDA